MSRTDTVPNRAVIFAAVLCVCCMGALPSVAADPLIWNLWPGTPPGEVKELGPEHDTTTADGNLVSGRRVARITDVSVPQLAIYKPAAQTDTGTAVIIAPGGGFSILAYDLEGEEVAAWLNGIGVTAIVLKYRVPARDPEKRWLSAVQDAQRAVSVVRSRAAELGVDANRIGLMGFSAGGAATQLTALLPERQYKPVDQKDTASYRPDFAAPIYPGGGLPEGVEIPADAPPFFVAIAHDDKDRSIGAAEFYIALKKAGVSAELHIYESGGHGYGLRRTEQPVTSWNERMADWMRQLKLLEK